MHREREIGVGGGLTRGRPITNDPAISQDLFQPLTRNDTLAAQAFRQLEHVDLLLDEIEGKPHQPVELVPDGAMKGFAVSESRSDERSQ